jgi:hypothetical protein
LEQWLGYVKQGSSRRMLARMISLESRQTKLDGKVSNLLEKTHANSQALIDIQSVFSKFLGKLKDEPSSHLKHQASPHDANMVPKKIVAIHDVDPLDTFVGSSGNEVNVHSFSRGQIDSLVEINQNVTSPFMTTCDL